MLFSILCTFLFLQSDACFYKSMKGKVEFESNAPLENIKANSEQLRGVLNTKNNKFSFAIKLNSFQGFNSALQMEHYNENYVESTLYSEAKFSGKIIENIPYHDHQKYQVRAKGDFSLHGITRNLIIAAQVYVISQNEIQINANFSIQLRDFEINIPRLVHRKLTESINIKVETLLTKEL